MPIDLVMLA